MSMSSPNSDSNSNSSHSHSSDYYRRERCGPTSVTINNINHGDIPSSLRTERHPKDGSSNLEGNLKSSGLKLERPSVMDNSFKNSRSESSRNLLDNTQYPIRGRSHENDSQYCARPQDLPNVYAQSESPVPLNSYLSFFGNNRRMHRDPAMNQLLQPSYGSYGDSKDQPSTCFYHNLEEAMEAKNKRRRDQFENALQNLEADHDIPMTEKTLRQCVKRLSQAIKDTTDVIDRPSQRGDGQPKYAQAVQRMKGDYYSPEVIEQVSWQVTHAARVAQVGVRLVDPHHKAKRESFRTFAERFDEIVKTCGASKAACKQLMDVEFIDRLVDAPLSILRQKLGNMELNGIRNMQVLAGRKAIEKSKQKVKSMTTARAGDEEDSPPDDNVQSETDDYEEQDMLAARPQTSTSTKRKTTPASKRSSVQRQKKAEMTPVSIKRKGSAHETEEETPSKKPKSASNRDRAEDTRLGATIAMGGPPPISQTAATLVVPPPRLSFETASATGNQPPRVQDIATLNYQYRLRICQILSVHQSYAAGLSLRYLRLYARAYNLDYSGTQRQYWQAPELASHHCSGIGYLVQPANIGNQRYHLVVHFPELVDLALARGDIDENLNPIHRESGIRPRNKLDGQAMGTCENVFGPHDNTSEAGSRL